MRKKDDHAEFEQYRAYLFSIAYRMVGSVVEAEDIVQDASVRWLQETRDDVRSPKSYLVTIVSRLCINHLESARVQREQYIGEWLPEPIETDHRSDPIRSIINNESISTAFLLLLERLSPIERAVFILRDVFEYTYSDIAKCVDLNEANCRQILTRAKQHISGAQRKFDRSATNHEELFERFLQAARNGDADGLVKLLASDAVLRTDGGGKARALPNVVVGAQNVARGTVGAIKQAPSGLDSRVARINGAPGLINYVDGKPWSVVSFDMDNGLIQAIFVVTNPDKLTRISDLSEDLS